MVQSTQRAAASAQRIWEILDRVSTVPEPARPVDPGDIRGEIVFQDVGFRYGNRAGARRASTWRSSPAR